MSCIRHIFILFAISFQLDRLKGRYLFRSAVRRVLEYIEWLTEEPVVEEVTDDVTIKIKITEEKKKEKKLLTLKVCEAKSREIFWQYIKHAYMVMRNLRLIQGPVDTADKCAREIPRGQNVHIWADQEAARVHQVSGGREGKLGRVLFLSISTSRSSDRPSRSQGGKSVLHRERRSQHDECRDRRINRWGNKRRQWSLKRDLYRFSLFRVEYRRSIGFGLYFN